MSKYSENMPPDLKSAIGWMYDYIEPKKTLLDFGCSTGYFGSFIKSNKQCAVYGVEISSDAKQAKKVLDDVYSFDIDGEWPIEVYERKYDYLFFGDVLEHLKEPGIALSKSKKLLKPDGKIFVSIPNIAHISTRLELLQGSFKYEPMGILDDTHLKYFTLSTFVELANKAGFKIEAIDSSVNDYPREIATKILQKVGLAPSDKFWALTETSEARIYQYKFVLVPTTSKIRQKNLSIKSLPPKPEEFRDTFIGDLRKQVKLLHEHSDKQAVIIEHFKNLNERLEAENEYLKSNLAHKIGLTAKKHIKKRKRQ